MKKHVDYIIEARDCFTGDWSPVLEFDTDEPILEVSYKLIALADAGLEVCLVPNVWYEEIKENEI